MHRDDVIIINAEVLGPKLPVCLQEPSLRISINLEIQAPKSEEIEIPRALSEELF
jgi:hypothetical protein